MEQVDICILGGGMAGVSVAWHLAGRGEVLLLEREPQLAYHSTGRSAALFAPLYGGPAIRLLTHATGPFLQAPPPGFAAAPLLKTRGFLTLGTQAQRAEAEAQLAAARALGTALLELSPQQARARLPALRADRFDWALLDESAADIDVDLLFQGFLRGARAGGARIQTGREVTRIEHSAGRWLVTCGDCQVSARVIVNAAGAWADEIARLAGLRPLQLVPHRRTAFIFDAPAGVATAHWPMVSDAGEHFYFKPDAGRLLGSLSEEVPSPPCDAQADDLDVATAVDRIEQHLEFPVTRVLRAWTGLRTFGPDREPVSGFDPQAPGFYWHAGLGGYGIQTSAALGAFAASRILEAPLPDTLTRQGFDARCLGVERLTDPS